MRSSIFVATAAAALAAAQYEFADVCPACADVTNSEISCNKPTLAEHADCMCRETSFFADWDACRNCLVEKKPDHAKGVPLARQAMVMAIAQPALCAGSPTASFQHLFEKAYQQVAGREGYGHSAPSTVAPTASTSRAASATSTPLVRPTAAPAAGALPGGLIASAGIGFRTATAATAAASSVPSSGFSSSLGRNSTAGTTGSNILTASGSGMAVSGLAVACGIAALAL